MYTWIPNFSDCAIAILKWSIFFLKVQSVFHILQKTPLALRGRLQEAELHLPLFFRLSKVLLVHVLKPCLANSGTFMPLLVEQHVSNWWTSAVADGVTSILMTSEAISAVGKYNLVSLLRFYRMPVSYLREYRHEWFIREEGIVNQSNRLDLSWWIRNFTSKDTGFSAFLLLTVKP